MSGIPSIPLQLPDLGNALAQGTHAGYYAQEAALKRGEEERRVAAQPYIEGAMKGDAGAMGKVAAGDPKTAALLSTALQRMDVNKRADLKAQAEYTSNAANAVLQANPADRPELYRQLHAEGTRRNYNMSNLPPEYTPQLDGQLRGYRALAVDINKELDRQTRLQIHNSPVGSGETSVDMPSGGTPAPAPAASPRTSALGPGGGFNGGFSPPDVRQATAIPAAAPAAAPAPATAPAPPTMVAQATPPDQGDTALNAPPDLKEPPKQPKRNGAFFEEDPSQFGYVQQGIQKRGSSVKTPQVVEGGYFVYRNPQTGEHVLYKPGQKPQGPQGSFAGQGIEAQYGNILQGGDPGTPEYALAYAHFARSHTTIDDQGRPVTIQPMDMSPFRKPTFNANGPAPAQTPAGPAPAGPASGAPASAPPPAGPGAPNITVGAPIPGAGKPPNNEQARDMGFADRMSNSNSIIAGVENQGKSTGGRFKESLPFGAGNFAQSDDYQKFKQARDDFINAQLRRESGAAINADEYTKADKQYFPVPGDGDAVIKQKALNRKIAVESMGKGAGPNYKPRAPEDAGSGGPRLSPEDAAKLPSGTKFIGMDGVERTRH